MAGRERIDQRARMFKTLINTALSPVGAGAAAATVVATFYTLPSFENTRRGISEGMDTETVDVLPGNDATLSILLKTAGLVLGGGFGLHTSWATVYVAAQRGALPGYAQVPVAVFGGIVSAFLGMEMGEPAANTGVRIGRTISLGMEGLRFDFDAMRGGGGSSSGSISGGRSSSSGGNGGEGGSGSGDRGSGGSGVPGDSTAASREGGRRRWWGWGGSDSGGGGGRGEGSSGGGGGGGRGGTRGGGSVASVSERDAAAMVESSMDALSRELVRLRRCEQGARLERSRIASSARRRDLDRRLADIRAAKADLKTRCKEEHGEKLGRVITADIAGRADALTNARARQLALRAEADCATDKVERRHLQREARMLDKHKRALKSEARAMYGVKLSRHAPNMEKA